MARTFRRKHPQHPISELNVTNLIDLGFTLLIIFMIATPLINQEQTLPINLPLESKSAQTKPDPGDKFETITIKADGTISIGGRQLTAAQLSRELTSFASQAKPPVFRIRGDAKTTLQQLVVVMDELKKHGLFKVTIDTQTKN